MTTPCPLDDSYYRCAICGGIFAKAWTDEEARIEYEVTMPLAAERGDDVAEVCEGCYQSFIAWAGRMELGL